MRKTRVCEHRLWQFSLKIQQKVPFSFSFFLRSNWVPLSKVLHLQLLQRSQRTKPRCITVGARGTAELRKHINGCEIARLMRVKGKNTETKVLCSWIMLYSCSRYASMVFIFKGLEYFSMPLCTALSLPPICFRELAYIKHLLENNKASG